MLSRIFGIFTRKERKAQDNRWIFISMLVGGLGSLLASFVLSVEAIELALKPDAVLNCSINVVINCATVALHPTAHLLGFPNSFFGLMAEPIVITIAVAGLMGVVFPRKFMVLAQIGYSFGLIFAIYLFGISFFVIGALCPWCLLVTATTMFEWFAITRYNIREDNLYLKGKFRDKARSFIENDYDKLVLFSMIMVIVVMILIKYGKYLI